MVICFPKVASFEKLSDVLEFRRDERRFEGALGVFKRVRQENQRAGQTTDFWLRNRRAQLLNTYFRTLSGPRWTRRRNNAQIYVFDKPSFIKGFPINRELMLCVLRLWSGYDCGVSPQPKSGQAP